MSGPSESGLMPDSPSAPADPFEWLAISSHSCERCGALVQSAGEAERFLCAACAAAPALVLSAALDTIY